MHRIAERGTLEELKEARAGGNALDVLMWVAVIRGNREWEDTRAFLEWLHAEGCPFYQPSLRIEEISAFAEATKHNNLRAIGWFLAAGYFPDDSAFIVAARNDNLEIFERLAEQTEIIPRECFKYGKNQSPKVSEWLKKNTRGQSARKRSGPTIDEYLRRPSDTPMNPSTNPSTSTPTNTPADILAQVKPQNTCTIA